MKPKVLVTKPISQEVETYVREFCDVTHWDDTRSREEMLQEIKEYDGLLTTSGTNTDREFLEHSPKLKVISNMSVGYNNFDIEAMKERNIVGTHTPYVLDDTVADLVLGLMISTARRIPELDRFVKEGKWTSMKDEPLFGVDVHHTTVGIIGMGRIGETIARKAKYGFDMNVLYYNRSRKLEFEEQLGATYAELDTLLPQSDFIVLMTPLTDETYHLIGKKQFELMKESAIFINASRGPTVDEHALIEALQNGQIRGAGLDVFTQEPVEADNPLLKMDNVVTLPHIGSATARTRNDMAMLAAKNLVAALTGGQPENIVKELKN